MKKLWSPELKRVYARFPALIRSSKAWDAVVELVRKGDQDGAMEIGIAQEKRSPAIRAQNTIARAIRIQRMQLFTLQTQTTLGVHKIFGAVSKAIASTAAIRADRGISALPGLKVRVRTEMVSLRRDLNKLITDSIWKSVLLGVRNMEDALVPIFKANQESFADDIGMLVESGRFKVAQLLTEERLSVGLTAKLAGSGKPKLTRGSTAWDKATDKIYQSLVKKGIAGQTPSERIWDLTHRTEMDLNRLLAQKLAEEGSPRDIAKSIEKYLSPSILSREGETGQGVYRSPFKNAMRLARTEVGRAYVEASSQWASSREWVKGLMVTLSPAHDGGTDGDACDDLAGEVYDASEFPKVVPVHPHCMCFPTTVIKEEYLDPDRVEKEEESHEEVQSV